MVSAETIKEDEDIFNLFMGLCRRQKKQNLLTLSNGYPDANEALSIHRIACNFRVANDDITFDETSSRRITQVINATPKANPTILCGKLCDMAGLLPA